MSGFKGKMAPKHILDSKHILIAFTDLINRYISINDTPLRITNFAGLNVLSLIFQVHFRTNIIYLFDSGHILSLVFEKLREFWSKYLAMNKHLLLHSYTNLFYSFIYSQLFVSITLQVELTYRIFHCFENVGHLS